MHEALSTCRDTVTTLIVWLRQQNYRFVAVTPATHARVTGRCSAAAANTLRDVFGWNLSFHRDLLPRNIFATLLDGGAIQAEGSLWRSTVRVSSLGDDLFAHSSFPTTEADAVFFGPDTYRFASAIEHCLADFKSIRRAADIGCGSGAGGLLIARSAPEANVFLADINARALKFAHANLAAADLANVKLVQSDIFSHLPGEFDFAVANPPYLVDAAARAYRHGGRKIGTELSLRILFEMYDRLDSQGTGLIYTGAPIVRGQDIFKTEAERFLRSRRARWTYEEMDPDVFGEELELPAYADVERIAVVVLTFVKDEH